VPAKNKQPRRKKVDWLRAALSVLEAEGVQGVRVERLARDLNVAKSGFYWHFRDRQQLYDDLVDYWEREFTQAVTQNAELALLPPEERLRRTSQLIFEHDLNRFDLAFRAWGQADPEVLARFNRIEEERLAWLRQIFREFGFKGAELEMRVRIFVGYHSWERSTLPPPSKAQAKRLIKRRIDFFLHP
jgi:AcrR family transcriptional regulator